MSLVLTTHDLERLLQLPPQEELKPEISDELPDALKTRLPFQGKVIYIKNKVKTRANLFVFEGELQDVLLKVDVPGVSDPVKVPVKMAMSRLLSRFKNQVLLSGLYTYFQFLILFFTQSTSGLTSSAPPYQAVITLLSSNGTPVASFNALVVPQINSQSSFTLFVIATDSSTLSYAATQAQLQVALGYTFINVPSYYLYPVNFAQSSVNITKQSNQILTYIWAITFNFSFTTPTISFFAYAFVNATGCLLAINVGMNFSVINAYITPTGNNTSIRINPAYTTSVPLAGLLRGPVFFAALDSSNAYFVLVAWALAGQGTPLLGYVYVFNSFLSCATSGNNGLFIQLPSPVTLNSVSGLATIVIVLVATPV